ncbi:MAG: hypothetical protein R3296_01385 [Oleiphilaceae bacterium]|nr:hypothetical protein [Oleiphilaceae bacterium]
MNKLRESFILKILALLISISIAIPAYTNEISYAEKTPPNENWFYQQGNKLVSKLKNQIEKSINESFEENIFKLIGEQLGDSFAKKFTKDLAGVVSVGPFVSLDSLLVLSGLTNSGDERVLMQIRVMTEILLEAIDTSKEEIIAAVDKQFQDETEARLNTIIRELDRYNSRSEAGRRAHHWKLNSLINDASYVMERFEIKSEKHIDNIHLYINIASLQLIMEKEFTEWRYLEKINPHAGEEEIKAEVNSVLATQIYHANKFITSRTIGSLEHWRNNFHSQFPDIDNINAAFERIPTLSEWKKINGHSKEGLLEEERKSSAVFSYSMGGEKVEFMQIVKELPFGMCQVYDTSNKLVGQYASQSMPVGPYWVYYGCDKSGNKKLFRRAVENHRDSDEAFFQYLEDGYLPAIQMVDAWWDLAEVNYSRPISEVESHILNKKP